MASMNQLRRNVLVNDLRPVYVSGTDVFVDTSLNLPARTMKIAFHPEDANGFDHHWKGGDGINLIDVATHHSYWEYGSGITWTFNADGTVVANGTATANCSIGLYFSLPPGEYYFSGCPPEEGAAQMGNIYMWNDDTDKRAKRWDGSTDSDTDYGKSLDNQVLIESGMNYNICLRVYNGQTADNMTFRPMIRKATDAADRWHPYENICQFAPWGGSHLMSVYIHGKNMFDQSKMTNNTYFFYNNSGGITRNASTYVSTVDVQPSSTYAVSFGGSGYMRVSETDTEGAFIKRHLSTKSPINITTSSNCYGLQLAADATVTNIQVERGAATGYVAYSDPVEHVVDLQDAPVDVYGGVYDLATGRLEMPYRVINSYNGEPLPSIWYSDRDTYAAGTSPTIGAQVIYLDSTADVYYLTPDKIRMKDVKRVFTDSDDMDVVYWT